MENVIKISNYNNEKHKVNRIIKKFSQPCSTSPISQFDFISNSVPITFPCVFVNKYRASSQPIGRKLFPLIHKIRIYAEQNTMYGVCVNVVLPSLISIHPANEQQTNTSFYAVVADHTVCDSISKVNTIIFKQFLEIIIKYVSLI